MLAAEAAFDACAPAASTTNSRLPGTFKRSWLHKELHKARNFKQWMSKGLLSAR